MRENFVQSMAMQVEAQIHEESKFWSTSQPFAKLGNRLSSQSEMQGRNPTCSNFACLCKIFAQHAKSRGGAVARLSEGQFPTLCEISHTLRNHKMQQKTNFAHHAKLRMVCEIFLCTASVRFLSPDFCVNYYFLLVINQ